MGPERVVAAVLAFTGHHVVAADIDEDHIRRAVVSLGLGLAGRHEVSMQVGDEFDRSQGLGTLPSRGRLPGIGVECIFTPRVICTR